jgi:hypothetical protein
MRSVLEPPEPEPRRRSDINGQSHQPLNYGGLLARGKRYEQHSEARPNYTAERSSKAEDCFG